MQRTTPAGWSHDSGRRLNYDGARIEYEHESGITASVEAMVNEEPDEPDRLEFRPAIHAEDGMFIEYPDIFYDKDKALDEIYELMDEYPTIEYPDLPNEWEWWSGNSGPSHYTHWFGTEEAEGGYEGEVYWDEGGDHHVAIYPVKGIREDGDPNVSEYADARGSYETKQAAINAIPELIKDLDA